MILTTTPIVGQSVRLPVAFYDASGSSLVLTDCSGPVICTVKDPSGAKTVYTYAASQVVRDGVGSYHLDVTPQVAGTWTVRWEGDMGMLVAISETSFTVQASTVI